MHICKVCTFFQKPIPHSFRMGRRQTSIRMRAVVQPSKPSCMMLHAIQGGAPPVISWFIIPLTIDITPINPSYIVLINQLS